jgi:hypothetical protein
VKLVLGVACAVLAAAGAARAAPTLVALTGSGALLVFDAEHPEAAAGVAVHGESGTLVGIDLRPADRKLYGLTTTNEIYRIDPRTGEAKLLCSLTAPFDGGARSGIDFNPQADRLRLVSSEGQNLRVNVEIGATAVDRPLAYAPGDPNAGRRPGIAASAYDHPVAGATTTKLYEIDAARDVLVVQDPPNDGVLRTGRPARRRLRPRGGVRHREPADRGGAGLRRHGLDALRDRPRERVRHEARSDRPRGRSDRLAVRRGHRLTPLHPPTRPARNRGVGHVVSLRRSHC